MTRQRIERIKAELRKHGFDRVSIFALAKIQIDPPRGVKHKDFDSFVRLFQSRFSQREPSDCWPWLGAISSVGYGQIRWKNVCLSAHVVAFELKVKREVSMGLHVMHSCNNRQCVNPHHLSEGTRKENMQWMARCGRTGCNPLFGSDHPHALLNEDQVRKARSFTRKEIMRYGGRRLAFELGITYNYLLALRRKPYQQWRHLQ